MKKHSFRSLVRTLAIVGSLGAVIYVVFKNGAPTDDPWAEAYWEDVTPAKAE